MSDEAANLEPANESEWLRSARALLAHHFGVIDSAAVKWASPDGPPAMRLNVTLRVRGAVRGSMSGSGATFLEQLHNAVINSAADSRFAGPIVSSDLDSLSIEIWIQTGAIDIPVGQREDASVFTLGLDGVEIEQGQAFAYYKPSVALTSNFISMRDLFSALCRKARLPEEAWRDSSCRLRKTSWVHLSEDGCGGTVRLHGLRCWHDEELRQDIILGWIKGGAEYLANNQMADGQYCYIYNPLNGKSSVDDINTVRAAGCIYAMTAAASATSSAEYRARWADSAERAVGALLHRSIEDGEGGLFIKENGEANKYWGKLGSAALLAVALSYPVLKDKYNDTRLMLLRTLLNAQQPNGSFRCTLGDGRESDRHINFYPGQALLALAIEAQSGDMKCRESCYRAFSHYRQHFRDRPRTAFVLWQVDAWRRVATLLDHSTPTLPYADFVFEQIDWVLPFQVGPGGPRHERGGFAAGGPPQVSSCVYTEAVLLAAQLAYKVGDEKRWQRYRTAGLEGLRFCSRLIIGNEQRPFLFDPKRAVGGVTQSISSFEVRCDYVQHLISLSLAAQDILATA